MTGLLDLHEEFPEALEHELISLGLRWRDLGTERLSWRDLLVVVMEAPASGALARSKYPGAHERTDRLLELLEYHLAVGNTQRGNQSGAKRHEFPKPPAWASGGSTTTYGSKPIPIDDMAAWLGGDFLTL